MQYRDLDHAFDVGHNLGLAFGLLFGFALGTIFGPAVVSWMFF